MTLFSSFLGCSMLQGIPGLIVAAADPLAAQVSYDYE